MQSLRPPPLVRTRSSATFSMRDMIWPLFRSGSGLSSPSTSPVTQQSSPETRSQRSLARWSYSWQVLVHFYCWDSRRVLAPSKASPS